MKHIEDYAYLWDGTDPGWIILDTCQQYAEVSLVFSAQGPSLRDVADVRSTLPAYAQKTATEVWTDLKGRARLPLGTLELREARELADRCLRLGLTIEIVARDASSRLPYHESRKLALVIEDAELSESVCRTAIEHGVRIDRIEA